MQHECTTAFLHPCPIIVYFIAFTIVLELTSTVVKAMKYKIIGQGCKKLSMCCIYFISFIYCYTGNVLAYFSMFFLNKNS